MLTGFAQRGCTSLSPLGGVALDAGKCRGIGAVVPRGTRQRRCGRPFSDMSIATAARTYRTGCPGQQPDQGECDDGPVTEDVYPVEGSCDGALVDHRLLQPGLTRRRVTASPPRFRELPLPAQLVHLRGQLVEGVVGGRRTTWQAQARHNDADHLVGCPSPFSPRPVPARFRRRRSPRGYGPGGRVWSGRGRGGS